MDRAAVAGKAGAVRAERAMNSFVHEAPAVRVVFGDGSLDRVPAEVAALDRHRALVIAGGAASGPGDRLAARLGPRAAGRFSRIAPHAPEPLIAEAVATARAAGADALCSVGGGSATGLAKAAAVALDLPIVAVPTTYAGSEATAAYGTTGTDPTTGEERKRTVTDPRARVRTVVYDPELTVDLPPRTSAASAYNALAHAVAALTAPAYHPMPALYAAEAVRLITRALPAVLRHPADRAARGELLWASWLAGSSLAGAGTGLHHRLCHVLGGRYRLVHADLHAVLLPYTVAWDEALDLAPVARLLGADPAGRLRELAATAGLPDRLAAIGAPADGLAGAAAEAAERIDPQHPRHGDADWFRGLLAHAYQPQGPAYQPQGAGS